MANPQKEDGHVDIANEIVEALAKTQLSSYESRVLWVVFRKTYGWHKKVDWIANIKISEMTGIAEPHISRTIKRLTQRNIIIKNGKKLAFQKDYDQWEKLPIQDKKLPIGVRKVTNRGKKKLPIQDKKLPIGVRKVTNRGKKKLPIQVYTKEKKETYIKETIQKAEIKKLDFEAPTKYLNQKAKRGFISGMKIHKDLVKARYNEGRTLDDFKKVIDKKCKDWLNDEKMMRYLRPSTLFNKTNFENYLNEPEPDKYSKYYEKE